MNMQIGFADIIAVIALFLSAYSMKKTSDFNKQQKKFIVTNDKLNKMLLANEINDDLDKKKADISANFIEVDKSNCRLKVFNRGHNTAKNIKIEFPTGNDILLDNDIKEKFPIPILEQYQSVEVIASNSLSSPKRLEILLIWDDDFSQNNKKKLTPTVV